MVHQWWLSCACLSYDGLNQNKHYVEWYVGFFLLNSTSFVARIMHVYCVKYANALQWISYNLQWLQPRLFCEDPVLTDKLGFQS